MKDPAKRKADKAAKKDKADKKKNKKAKPKWSKSPSAARCVEQAACGLEGVRGNIKHSSLVVVFSRGSFIPTLCARPCYARWIPAGSNPS